jgi:hypothetical protein
MAVQALHQLVAPPPKRASFRSILQNTVTRKSRPWWFAASVVLLLIAGVSFSSRTGSSKLPKQAIRIFGPSSSDSQVLEDSPLIHHQVFSEDDRLYFLQTRGNSCWPKLTERYELLSPSYQVQVWKYCYLYLGHGNVYQDEGVSWFVDPHDVLKPYQSLVFKNEGAYHSSFLQLHKKQVARRMVQVLMETPLAKLQANPLLLPNKLYQLMESVRKIEYQSHCRDLGGEENPLACPLKGGFCCQVMKDDQVLAALQHPLLGASPSVAADANANDTFFSTVTVHLTGNEPATSTETPNFFDVLLHNDCLPTSKSCYKCLKRAASSCTKCAEECGCYCKALCTIKPPPKVVTQIWKVHPPLFQKDPSRLIPRLVHQTWFEPVTREKYPNMSRLIQSWKTSGWDYTFYDDDAATAFLTEHFPPQVREAYDAILPGAFKADLFRYCVLLIKGGIYADMDLILESNLDAILQKDVGFMVPIDEPGSNVGHRSCLWNGLLAVAPGHAFMAQTIELVVNNIRNRFTSVDYDDMLCPAPVLSVSHTVDTLFTCGPCILGGAMNQVLGRHMQTEWELGDVDIWKVPPRQANDARHGIWGRTIILAQNKQDMGAHRFTWLERNIMVAATDMPDYDDRPPTKQHYSRTHEKVGVYGLRNLYKDNIKANEEIRIVVEMSAVK